MAIAVTCTCGKALRVKDGLAGRRFKCPACGQVLEVPSPPSSDEPRDLQPAVSPDVAVAPERKMRTRLVLIVVAALGALLAIVALVVYRSPDPRNHVLSDAVVRKLLGDRNWTYKQHPLLMGFEGVSFGPGESQMKADSDPQGRYTRVTGLARLSDGRQVQFDRTYRYRDDGACAVTDKSTITDSRRRVFKSDLLETKESSRTTSIEGTITDPSGRQHSIHRTFRYIQGTDAIHVEYEDKIRRIYRYSPNRGFIEDRE